MTSNIFFNTQHSPIGAFASLQPSSENTFILPLIITQNTCHE